MELMTDERLEASMVWLLVSLLVALRVLLKVAYLVVLKVLHSE